ncbi:MAG: hypothetical protein V1793_03785 [Pseudomonadota bacterium]
MNLNPEGKQVLWLLNWSPVRQSDWDRLIELGFSRIFCPIPFRFSGFQDGRARPTGVPVEVLEILDSQDWYGPVNRGVWDKINQYFDIVVFRMEKHLVSAISRFFKGTAVMRILGRTSGVSYTDMLYDKVGITGVDRIRRMGDRFWIASVFDCMHPGEGRLFRQRHLFLPWVQYSGGGQGGEERRILFACPHITTCSQASESYRRFLKDFEGLPYIILGGQALGVPDPNVLEPGPGGEYRDIIRSARVMYCGAQEDEPVDDYVFEAMGSGVPIVFAVGGMLDRIGGKGLPGRTKTAVRARRMIESLLYGNWRLAERIRKSQDALFMARASVARAWEQGVGRIMKGIGPVTVPGRPGKKKIAVILPSAHHGGSVRGALLLAEAVYRGSRQAGEPADVVFGHLDSPSYTDNMFDGIPEKISRRAFSWKITDNGTARLALYYAGHDTSLKHPCYCMPDDAINNFLDCNLWIIISDRIPAPLLPLRPYMIMVYDYIQRFYPFPGEEDMLFLDAAREADGVLFTTKFTLDNGLQYAGISPEKTYRVPMLSTVRNSRPLSRDIKKPMFVWPTNLSLHKNHVQAFRALRIYYDELNGGLECWITGFGTQNLLEGLAPHLTPLTEIVQASPQMKQKIRFKGELSDFLYRRTLASARFLWHTATADNGTFSVLEADSLGVPALSSHYPAMMEMAGQYGLSIEWFDVTRPDEAARELKRMEAITRKRPDTPLVNPGANRMEQAAIHYWEAVRSCL